MRCCVGILISLLALALVGNNYVVLAMGRKGSRGAKSEDDKSDKKGKRSDKSEGGSKNKGKEKKSGKSKEKDAVSREIRKQQLAALSACRVKILGSVFDFQEIWSEYIKGTPVEWTDYLIAFIERAPYGMVYYQQGNFCERIIKWIRHFDGGKLGLCALLNNFDLRHDGVDLSPVKEKCAAIGFDQSNRKLFEDTTDNPCANDRSTVTNYANSPFQCFEPDPSMYYTFQGSRPNGYGFLSHNYEWIADTCVDKSSCLVAGSPFSFTCCQYENQGESTGQSFYQRIATEERVNSEYYATYTVEDGFADQFLADGHVIQDVVDNALTQAMWRFNTPGKADGMWYISNRATGMVLNVYADQLIADTYANKPLGCNFCKESTNDLWDLVCYFTNSNSQPQSIAFSGSFTNYNASLSQLNCCLWCIQNVTEYTRADVTSPGAVTYVPGPTSLYPGQKYVKTSLDFLKIPLIISGLGSVAGGISALQGIVSDVVPGKSQVDTINTLANAVLDTATSMSIQLDAGNNVDTSATEFNTQRDLFQCNYVGNLNTANDNFKVNAPAATISDYICNTLLDDLDEWILEDLNAWNQIIKATDTLPSSCDNQCRINQETSRLGWDMVKVGITDMMWMLQEEMTLYSFLAGAFGLTNMLPDVCGVSFSLLAPTGSTSGDICQNIYDRYNFGTYVNQFREASINIPANLKKVRMNEETLIFPGSPPDDEGNTSPTWTFTKGTNEKHYSLADSYFSVDSKPTGENPKVLANIVWSDGFAGDDFPEGPPSNQIMTQYSDEINWDMENWSYDNSALLEGISDSALDKSFLGVCEAILADPMDWWNERMATLEQGCTSTCQL